jgi:uncharacterized RDD family membrane protein YckC
MMMSYAPFKIRIYAFLVDYLVIVGYSIFVLGTISVIFRESMKHLFSSSPLTAELAGFLFITLPVSLYFIIGESSKSQGTLGKRKMGILVADDSGQRIRIGRSACRTAIKFFPWEVAHFGIWHLMLPSDISENTVLIILAAVNLVILIYLTIPLTKTFTTGLQEQKYCGLKSNIVPLFHA